MTYTLPFGLKAKPLPHYFEHGVIKFSMNEGTMSFQVKQITKEANGTIYSGVVKDKEHLERLLKTKSIYDVLRSTEAVK